jgi:transposase
MIRELLEAQRTRKSEKLSIEQSGLFEELWRKTHPDAAPEETLPDVPASAEKKRAARRPLARHVTRERIVHDLPEAEKHCGGCGRDLRLIAEETSERYEYIPASLKVIEDVRRRYACDCTVKAAEKPAQPIEKSTAGASLLAHIIVAKWADHQPLHRQQQMLARHGVEISRKTMGGWMAQCAGLLEALYGAAKKELFGSHVVGTDDTAVKVLETAVRAHRTHLALCGRCAASGDCLRLHADAGAGGSGEIPRRIQRVPAGGCVFGLRRLLQTGTRSDRSRMLDACAQVLL